MSPKILISKNHWNFHSELPEALEGSSVVVVDNVMYNIGGDRSSHSVYWYPLLSNYQSEWKFMDLNNFDFSGYYYIEAFVLENTIVYFGYSAKKTTFLLGKEEESERLEVLRHDEGSEMWNEDWIPVSGLFKRSIYVF